MREGYRGHRLAVPLSGFAKHPFAHAQLADEDLSVDFASQTTPQDRVALVVTQPLTTNEAWTAFRPGELRVFVGGEASA